MTAMKDGRPDNADDVSAFLLLEVQSAALSRLIEEVRSGGNQGQSDMTAYNRTYHRHNR